MEMTAARDDRDQDITDLFAATFTAAKGPDGGTIIRGLVRDLLADTPPRDIRVFRAKDHGRIVAAAIFTRLTLPEDPHVAFLLSSMAVSTRHQRQGIGQALLSHALTVLRDEGVQIAFTYGDPDFYRRVGFWRITEDTARAPLPLSRSHGWIAQPLTGRKMPVLSGPSICVPALDRADLW